MPRTSKRVVLTKKFQITLPKKIRDILGVKSGDQVTFVVEDNAVYARLIEMFIM